MSGWTGSLDAFVLGASSLLSVIGLWFAAVIPGIDRWSRRFFMLYFAIFMLCCLSWAAELAFQHYAAPGAAFYLLLLFETLLLSLPLPMLTVYLLHCCSEDMRSSGLLRAVLCFWAVFVVLLACTPLIGGIVYITPENQYFHGPLYALVQAPAILILLLNLAGAVRRRARLSRKVFLGFVVAQVPMAAVLVVNLFVDVMPLFELSYVLSALAMYSLVLSDQIEQDRRQREIARQQREIAEQQREIAHARASVMVLRMRPHFIFNTLMSIHSLCSLDPRKAQQVTADFTDYLRRNFKAIASDSAVPFSTELEHTRAYLAVEQAQYDDMLSVDYDVEFTGFRLPPLTLQPLVENAVKHGMNPDAGPLRVCIRTLKAESGCEVVVEDNGPGFDPAIADDPHTTLVNIRQRLRMMCGGTLQIGPRGGGGTVVRMEIPQPRNPNALS